MEVTLTHLDGTKGAHELLPNADPTSGVTVFTGRPCRGGDRPYGLTQDLLAGFGVRNDVAGAGRQVSEDLLHIRARFRAYETRMVVVRHADMLLQSGNTDILELLANTCVQEGVDLALTCDDTGGELLADWVDAQGGRIHGEASELFSQIPRDGATADKTRASFPRNVPKGDFYVFRARAREVLPAVQFSAVDSCYVRVAREIHTAPFTTNEEAADDLLGRCQTTDNLAEVTTILRAAQAAMFRHGIQLKVDVPFFTRLVADRLHRPLHRGELLALRAYRATWRSATVALLDAGLSYERIAETIIDDVANTGQLTAGPPLRPEARYLLQVHRQFMLLSGATPPQRLINRDTPRLPVARRDAAIDLGIPGDTPQRGRAHRGKDRWRRALGVVLLPLDGAHLPAAITNNPTKERAA